MLLRETDARQNTMRRSRETRHKDTRALHKTRVARTYPGSPMYEMPDVSPDSIDRPISIPFMDLPAVILSFVLLVNATTTPTVIVRARCTPMTTQSAVFSLTSANPCATEVPDIVGALTSLSTCAITWLTTLAAVGSPFGA